MQIIDRIRKTFPQITELALQETIAEVGIYKQYQTGDILMNYGDYIRSVPLILKGTIKVLRQSENGNELFLYYLNAGETCAMAFTCCMMQRVSEIQTTAEEDCEVLAIPLKYMDDWMSKYPSWKNYIMTSYNNRFQELFSALDNIAFLKMDERLVKYLASKARIGQSNTLFTTHQDIARELNASREAVSRLLKKLERQNLIQLGRNKITLHKSPEELESILD